MIRINGHLYNASISYAPEKLIAMVATEESLDAIISVVKDATQVDIVNNDVTVASYAGYFNGIEINNEGYRITFNRNPMTVAEVEAIQRTVTEHTNSIASTSVELSDILDAITELGDLISEIIEPTEE